ncbi:hypothetical protein AAKU55_005285 [Oxalobacteraceae bacterium GrIS 1.11]
MKYMRKNRVIAAFDKMDQQRQDEAVVRMERIAKTHPAMGAEKFKLHLVVACSFNAPTNKGRITAAFDKMDLRRQDEAVIRMERIARTHPANQPAVRAENFKLRLVACNSR